MTLHLKTAPNKAPPGLRTSKFRVPSSEPRGGEGGKHLTRGWQTSEFRVKKKDRGWQTSEFRVKKKDRGWQTSEFRVKKKDRGWQTSEFRVKKKDRGWQTSEFRVPSKEERKKERAAWASMNCGAV